MRDFAMHFLCVFFLFQVCKNNMFYYVTSAAALSDCVGHSQDKVKKY